MTKTAAQPDNGARACSRCGAHFTCGIAAGGEHCWCFDLPNVIPLTDANAGGCLCPDCLRAQIAHVRARAGDSADERPIRNNGDH